MSHRVENFKNPPSFDPASIAKEEHAEQIPSAVSSQVTTSQLVPEWYNSPTGQNWADLVDDEQKLSDSTDAERSGSRNVTGDGLDTTEPSPITSTGTFFEKNDLTDAELQDIRYGDLSREIISLDLEGLPMKSEAKGWDKVVCVQVLDLQVRDANEATLADFFSNGEGSVTDHDDGSIEHSIPRKGEVNTDRDLPDLRQYIPDDTSQDIRATLQNSNEKFVNRNEWAQGQVDWHYMCQASRRLLASGEGERRPLLETAGRSEYYQTGSGLRTTAGASTPEARPMHHFNFNGEPVFCKSSTPPAVSCWVAESPALRYRFDYDGRLHRMVTSFEAAKYVDPYLKYGPEKIETIGGTALREQVTGQVEKIYPSHGTWTEDVLALDDDIPVNGGESTTCTSMFCAHVNHLPRLETDQVDSGDPIVNDDGRHHPPGKRSDRTVIGRPSWLSWMENVDDGEEEPESEPPVTVQHDTVSVREEVNREVPPQEKAVEKKAIAPSETSDGTEIPPRGSMAEFLAFISHLQTMPIEDAPAYSNAAWPSPSETQTRYQHDLTKWSEEPEKEEYDNDDDDFEVFHQEGFKPKADPENSINESPMSMRPGILAQDEQSEPKSEISDNEPGTPCEEITKDLTLNRNVIDEGDTHIYLAQHNTPEFDPRGSLCQNETKPNAETTNGVPVEALEYLEIVPGAKFEHDDPSMESTVEERCAVPAEPINKPVTLLEEILENISLYLNTTDDKDVHAHMGAEIGQPDVAPTVPNTQSEVIDYESAIEAINEALGSEHSGKTTALTDGSVATISREADHGSDAMREIDECLNEIQAIVSPWVFRTPRPSPFKRPQEALGFHSELSEYNSESDVDETSSEHLDIVVDKWSTSSEKLMSGSPERGGLGDTDQGNNSFMSSESPCRRSALNNLAFSGIQVLYDEAGNSNLGCGSEDSIADGMEGQSDTRTECSEEFMWEDVEVVAHPIHTLVSNKRRKDGREEIAQEDHPMHDENVAEAWNASIEGSGSESSDTTYPQDSLDASDLSDDDIPEADELDAEKDNVEVGSGARRYPDAATQTDDKACDDDAVKPPPDPNLTHFDCSGPFNISMPKASLTDCLLYGGVALFLGHQAYRAFRRQ
ncbi:hypothetical protein MMC30_006981 [Trapelia coarctata]|nr:hypothetical protein [Trapelia coarctata]